MPLPFGRGIVMCRRGAAESRRGAVRCRLMAHVRRRPRRGCSTVRLAGGCAREAVGRVRGPVPAGFGPGSGRVGTPWADGSVRGPVSPVANKPQIWNPAT